jgi:hypothetical protein
MFPTSGHASAEHRANPVCGAAGGRLCLIAKSLKSQGFEPVGDGPQIDLRNAQLEHAIREFGKRQAQDTAGVDGTRGTTSLTTGLCRSLS